jgi:hypothetical protein
MKKSNAQSANESASISDAEMAAVLANPHWAKMEFEATNFAAVKKVAKKTAAKNATPM